MNRKTKLFVATIDSGEMFFLLDYFVSYYADRIMDEEECEYKIEEWEAGYIMANNSELKDYDEDYYVDPLPLWNELQEQVAWQRRRGVFDLLSADRLIVNDTAEMVAERRKRLEVATV